MSKSNETAPRAEGEGTGPLEKGILTDVTKCIGCERCVEACVKVNELPPDLPAKYKFDDGLNGDRYTSIVEIAGPEEGTWRAVRRQCMHCADPTCRASCLVGAFTRNPDGAIVYDADKCIGCRYCMLACPFHIPRYQYDKQLPYVSKCQMNEDCRVDGGHPACVTACPCEATVFGPRDKLIEEAKRRIAAEPDKYVDHIWGENEFSGTQVLYISDVPLWKTLRIPDAAELEKRAVGSLSHHSIPHLMHGWVMFTPIQFFGVASALGGYAFLKRRQQLMAETAAAEAKKNAPTGDDEQEG
jgi:Fe-S-cluster-containing dehydrogenase component